MADMAAFVAGTPELKEVEGEGEWELRWDHIQVDI